MCVDLVVWWCDWCVECALNREFAHSAEKFFLFDTISEVQNAV